MNVSANTEAMRKIAQQIRTEASAIKAEKQKIEATIEELKNGWQGPDNQQYIAKLEEDNESLTELEQIVDNYGVFIEGTATNLENVQDDIQSAAEML